MIEPILGSIINIVVFDGKVKLMRNDSIGTMEYDNDKEDTKLSFFLFGIILVRKYFTPDIILYNYLWLDYKLVITKKDLDFLGLKKEKIHKNSCNLI